MRLKILEDAFVICRLDAGAEIPAWASRGGLVSITRTPDELSIVCPERAVPQGMATSGSWRCFQVEGPLELTMVGIIASLTVPLADEAIPIFVVSTHATDYVLVPAGELEHASAALVAAGHRLLD